MAMNDTLAAAMNDILNAEKIGRGECYVKPNSKLTRAVLDIMKSNAFIAGYEIVPNGRGDLIKVQLSQGSQ